jgi:hypothetical protein
VELISWEELSQKTYPEPQFVLDPYIPAKGITLMWGDTSVGKSPVTWHMAAAIGSGKSFFGLPTKPGRVLYIESDTPETSVQPRLSRLQPCPENVYFLFLPTLSVPMPRGEDKDALRQGADLDPSVVFVNTLRKVHDMDDKESRTPRLVYSFFQNQFPSAAIFFTHHIRKRSTDPNAIEHEKEGFSGSKHWLDDAQCGLELQTFRSKDAENLRLYHRKSQVSERLNPLPLWLLEDGTNLRSPLYEQYLSVYDLMNSEAAEGMMAKDLDLMIARQLSVSESTAKRRRLDIEGHKFPGSREFLGREA